MKSNMEIWKYRNKVIYYFITLLLYYFITSVSYAHFEDTGIGARPVGLGNAYTALAEDIYAVYYNPACLSKVKWKEFGLNYEKLYWGLDDNSKLGNAFIGYTQPIKTEGRRKMEDGSWKNASLKMEEGRDWGTIGIGWLNFTLSKYYSENSFIIGYGKRIHYSIESEKIPDYIKSILNPVGEGNLSAGLNLKILSKRYGKTIYTENAANLDTGVLKNACDPVFENGYSKTALSIDLGFLYDFSNYHSVALFLKDINQPDMGFDAKDRIYCGMKIGYVYKRKDFNMVSDFSLQRGDIKFSNGAEKWFMNRTIAARGGLGIGSREYVNLSLGGTYVYSSIFQFDYSFQYPLKGIVSSYGTHQISLIMRFGMPPPEEVKRDEEVKELKTELEKVREVIKEEKSRAEKAIIAKNELEKTVYDVREKQLLAEGKLRRAQEEIAKAKELPVRELPVEEKKVEKAEAVSIEQETALKSTVLFDKDDFTLKQSAIRVVDHIAETLIVFPLQKANIEGHADMFEDEAEIISKKRAEVIYDYLIKEYDISTERLNILYFSADRPAADPSTQDGMAQNRRVEMTIIK